MYNFEEVKTFLMDKAQTQMTFRDDQKMLLLIKVPFNDDLAFLYGNEGRDDHLPLAFGEDLDYLGSLHYPSGILYETGYTFQYAVQGFTTALLYDLKRQAEDAICKEIERLVGNQPVPVTEDNTKKPCLSIEEFANRFAPDKALRAFYRGEKTMHYQSDYAISNPDILETVRLICDMPGFVSAAAKDYIRKSACLINDELKKIPIIQQKLDALYAMPGDHHCRLAISRSIREGMKTVQVLVGMDGESMFIRYDASTLGRCEVGDSYYPTWRMDAPSRKAFESKFGKSKGVYPRDVISITYGKKEIYRRKEATREATAGMG